MAEILRDPSDSGRVAAPVVVDDDHHLRLELTDVIERLIRHPAGEGSVTHDAHDLAASGSSGQRSGKHTFSFADPHYLATTAGRQYNIHLDKNKPVPDLVTLNSTATADSRYQKIVNDFASFGPPRFKKTVAAAREKLLKS